MILQLLYLFHLQKWPPCGWYQGLPPTGVSSSLASLDNSCTGLQLPRKLRAVKQILGIQLSRHLCSSKVYVNGFFKKRQFFKCSNPFTALEASGVGIWLIHLYILKVSFLCPSEKFLTLNGTNFSNHFLLIQGCQYSPSLVWTVCFSVLSSFVFCSWFSLLQTWPNTVRNNQVTA